MRHLIEIRLFTSVASSHTGGATGELVDGGEHADHIPDAGKKAEP